MNLKKLSLFGLFALITPAAIALTACGGNQTDVTPEHSIDFSLDSTYSVYSELIIQDEENSVYVNEAPGLTNKTKANMYLYASYIYDFSEIEILINGEPAGEVFTQNENHYDNMLFGSLINLGEINISKLPEVCTVSVRGVKEIPYELTFQSFDKGNIDTTNFDSNFYEKYAEKKTYLNDYYIKINDNEKEQLLEMRPSLSITDNKLSLSDVAQKNLDGSPFVYTRNLSDFAIKNGNTYTVGYFPIYRKTPVGSSSGLKFDSLKVEYDETIDDYKTIIDKAYEIYDYTIIDQSFDSDSFKYKEYFYFNPDKSSMRLNLAVDPTEIKSATLRLDTLNSENSMKNLWLVDYNLSSSLEFNLEKNPINVIDFFLLFENDKIAISEAAFKIFVNDKELTGDYGVYDIITSSDDEKISSYLSDAYTVIKCSINLLKNIPPEDYDDYLFPVNYYDSFDYNRTCFYITAEGLTAK